MTVNKNTWHALSFLKYLRDYGVELIVKLELIKDIKHEDITIDFITAEKIAEAKEACKGLLELLTISLAFDTAFRITELTTITVQQIEGNVIKVIAKGRKHHKGYITEKTKKLLDRWIALNDIVDGYIFPSGTEFDKPMSTEGIRNIMRRPFKRIGIENFHPHQLRHSTATTLLLRGADILTVKAVLGHANISTTNKYVHALDETVQMKHQELMSL